VAEADHAVKFQKEEKRTVEVCTPAEELAKPRENPFGATTAIEARVSSSATTRINKTDRYSESRKMAWVASVGTKPRSTHASSSTPPAYTDRFGQLTDDDVLPPSSSHEAPDDSRSVGMKQMPQSGHAVGCRHQGPILLHDQAPYPAKRSQYSQSAAIPVYCGERFGVPVGYSDDTKWGSPRLRFVQRIGAAMVETPNHARRRHVGRIKRQRRATGPD